MNMNREELVAAVAEKTGLSKAMVSKVLVAIIEVIVDAVKNGKKVALLGFGSFVSRLRPQREGRDPRTGATMTWPSKKLVKFVVGKKFSDEVNND